jgi:hypothetical protein
MNFLSALSLMNDGVREILPFIRYISQFIDFEFSAIKAQNRGKGVVCAATWIMPAAMVPRPWDFPDPPPPKPKEPEQSKEKTENVAEKKPGDARPNVNVPGAVPPTTPMPRPAEAGGPNSTMPIPMPGTLPISPQPSLPVPTMGPAISVASSTPNPETIPATAKEAIAPYVTKE